MRQKWSQIKEMWIKKKNHLRLPDTCLTVLIIRIDIYMKSRLLIRVKVRVYILILVNGFEIYIYLFRVDLNVVRYRSVLTTDASTFMLLFSQIFSILKPVFLLFIKIQLQNMYYCIKRQCLK